MEVLSRCPVGLRSRCVRVPEAVVHGFADSRSGEHARAFLADWRGSLICDDYGGYKAIFDNSMSDPTAWLRFCAAAVMDQTSAEVSSD